MKRITDQSLRDRFIEENKLTEILDPDILSYGELHLYERQEYILQAEMELEYYYMMVDGRIRVTYPFENGKPMLLKFYKDFITIGDIELLKNIPVLCDIEAVEDTYLIGIPARVLRTKFFDNLKFLHHLVDSLSDKLYATINNSSYNYVYPLINRLASYLTEQLTDQNYIYLDKSFKEIAEFLGTTYRHLSRTLKELEGKALIRCEDKRIHILDEAGIRELSKSSYMKSL